MNSVIQAPISNAEAEDLARDLIVQGFRSFSPQPNTTKFFYDEGSKHVKYTFIKFNNVTEVRKATYFT